MFRQHARHLPSPRLRPWPAVLRYASCLSAVSVAFTGSPLPWVFVSFFCFSEKLARGSRESYREASRQSPYCVLVSLLLSLQSNTMLPSWPSSETTSLPMARHGAKTHKGTGAHPPDTCPSGSYCLTMTCLLLGPGRVPLGAQRRGDDTTRQSTTQQRGKGDQCRLKEQGPTSQASSPTFLRDKRAKRAIRLCENGGQRLETSQSEIK
jgi:hypothetical protein